MALWDELDDLKKRIKKRAAAVIPDPLEDATAGAARYLAKYGGDAYRALDRFSRADIPDIVDVYDWTARRLDPAREVAFTVGENRLDPARALRELRQEAEQPGGLGAAFRARENTPAKRAAESALDPLLIAPVGRAGKAAGSVGKTLGEMAIRDVALPALGQIGLGEAGRRVGGAPGEAIGEMAGALLGGAAPNPFRGAPRPNLALATQALGAGAGAVGGYQATEGDDPYERAIATLGGAAVGGALGRRVAQGRPIGLGIEDIGRAPGQGARGIRQRLDDLKARTAEPDPLDAIPDFMVQSLPHTTRRGVAAINATINDVLNPARNRYDAHRAIGAAGGYVGQLQEANYGALLQADGLTPAARELAAAVTAGEIVPKPAYRQRIADAKTRAALNAQVLTDQALQAQRAGFTTEARRLKQQAIRAREAPALIDRLAMSGPAIVQYGDEFEFRSGGAQSAYQWIREAYDSVARREAPVGVSSVVRDQAIGRLWNVEPDEVAAFRTARTPDTQPGAHSPVMLTDLLDGLAQGYTPRTTDLPALFRARAEASNAAIVQQTFIRNDLAPRLVTGSSAAYRNDPTNYTIFSADFLRRTFPSLSMERAHELVGRLGTEVNARQSPIPGPGARRGAGETTQAGGMLYLPKEWGDELVAQLGELAAGSSPASKALGWLNDRFRTLKLGMDLAMLFRVGPAAIVQNVAADPLHPWRGVSAGFDALWDTAFRSRASFDLDPVTQRWVRYLPGFGRPGEMGEAYDIAARAPKGPVRVPVLGHAGRAVSNTYDALEFIQFGKFIPALQVRSAEAVYQAMKNTAAGRAMSDDELRRQVGTRVGTLVAGMGRSAAGVSRNRAFYERWGVISPTWARGLMKDTSDVFRGGVEGQLARRFWGGLAVIGVGSSVGLTMTLKGLAGGYGDLSNPDIEAMERDLKELLLDPTSRRNVWNPDSPNFLAVELPDGQGRLDIWGPFRPLLRTIASPVTGGVKGTAEELAEARKAGEDFSGAVMGEVLLGLLGGAADEMRTQAGRWAGGRMAIPPRQFYDALRNRDFLGRPIRTAESDSRRALQQTVYAGANLLPGIAEPAAPALLAVVGVDADIANVVGDSPRAVPVGLGSVKTSLYRAPLSALGINARFSSQDPGEVKQSIRDLATSKGLHAGDDPVAWYRKGEGIDQFDKAAFERANPHVRDYIETKRTDAAARQDRPRGREARTYFSGMQTQLRQKLRAQKEELGRLYTHPDPTKRITGDEYRKRRTEAERAYSISLQAAAQMTFGTSDLDAVYKEMERTDPFDRFLDDYYAIRPQGDDRASMDAFFAARAAFLDRLSPEQRAMFFKRQDDLAVDDTERAYLAGSRLMQERMRIPPYAGLSLEDGRKVQNALARVSDLQRRYPHLSRSQALMLDRSIEPRVKGLVLLYNRRIIRKNPTLTVFELRNPNLYQFFSVLLVDAFQDAQAS
jgi:hypothetical protein